LQHLREFFAGSPGHDQVVGLKNQVVQPGAGYCPECRQFGCGVLVVEDIERPNPHAAAAQMRVVKIVPVEGLQGDRRNSRDFLFRSGKGPKRVVLSRYLSWYPFFIFVPGDRFFAGEDGTVPAAVVGENASFRFSILNRLSP